MKGITASPGIALGKVLLLEKEKVNIDNSPIQEENIDKEIERYRNGENKTREQLTALKIKTSETLGEEEAEIFKAHLEMLEDPTLEESVLMKIKSDKLNAEAAAEASKNEICAMFESIDDEYMRERAADVRDVCERLIYNIAGINIVSLSDLDEEVIVVSNDLTPSDTASMNLDKVLGFVTDVGGRTSHTAIMARTLEIPAVVGTGDITDNVKNGNFVIVDALDGNAIINPNEDVIKEYETKREAFIQEKKKLEALKDLHAVTKDGKKVELCANIGNVDDTEGALRNGAEGIGLYRTEFLYMHSLQFPSEEEQFNSYKQVAEKMGDKPTIIRTLDIGGDKELSYFDFPEELNPFLGWRAIRMCFDKVDVFKTQLRAILRASKYGNLLIMYPMIISIEELRKANEILEECKKELREENIPFDENINVGIMVETPAVVVLAEKFAKEVDFFSIGTNDLTQYTLAVDRGNENIAYLYNSLHPAVLNSIKRVIDASHKEGKWTGMCGELAGDERAALILLGIGLDEFSMSAISIPKIKNLIRNSSYEEVKKIAEKALDLDTSEEIISYVDSILEK